MQPLRHQTECCRASQLSCSTTKDGGSTKQLPDAVFINELLKLLRSSRRSW